MRLESLVRFFSSFFFLFTNFYYRYAKDSYSPLPDSWQIGPPYRPSLSRSTTNNLRWHPRCHSHDPPALTVFVSLTFLMRKGYVHQDISPGNIIFYEGRAKLSDLEFAKKYMSGALSDVQTVSQPPSNILFFYFSDLGYVQISWR